MSDVSIARRPDPIAQALGWLLVWRHPRLWLAYSIAFGVLGPVFSFGLATWTGLLNDPIPIGLAAVPIDLYVLIATTTMAAWLAFGRNEPRMNAGASGVFLGGALFAAPFALICGFFGVAFLVGWVFAGGVERAALGLLGVQPVLSLVAYVVNAARAGRTRSWRKGPATLAFVASLGLPFAAWLALRSAATATESAILGTNRPLAELHLKRWRYLAPRYDWPDVVGAYLAPDGLSGPVDWALPLNPPRAERQRRIADAYELLTGRSIYRRD